MPATYEMLKCEKQNKRGDAKYNEAFFHSEWKVCMYGIDFLWSSVGAVPGEALKTCGPYGLYTLDGYPG